MAQKNQRTQTLNVRVPREIAGWIDSLVDKKIFSSRSEVIRHFLREYVAEQNEKKISQSIQLQNSELQNSTLQKSALQKLDSNNKSGGAK